MSNLAIVRESAETVTGFFTKKLTSKQVLDDSLKYRVVGILSTNTHLIIKLLLEVIGRHPEKDLIVEQLLKRWDEVAEEGTSKRVVQIILEAFRSGASLDVDEQADKVLSVVPKAVESAAPPTLAAPVNPFISLGSALKNRAQVAASAVGLIKTMYEVEREIKEIDWNDPYKKPLPFKLEMMSAVQPEGYCNVVLVPTICKFMKDGTRLDVMCRVDGEAISKEHCAKDENGLVVGEKLFTQGNVRDPGESFWIRPVLYVEGRTLRYYGHVRGGSDHPEAAAGYVMRDGGLVQIFDPEEWKWLETNRKTVAKLGSQPTPQRL